MLGSKYKKTFRTIGVVHTAASDQQIKDCPRKNTATVEILSKFEEALEGLDGFSHLFVLSYFHKLRPEQIGPLKVKPKRATKRGFKLEELPSLGVFAIDSPTRPNPIGLTLVQLLKRDRCKLFIEGNDLFDGTPVIDIKPYQPDYKVNKYALPEWYLKFMDKKGHV